MQHQKYIFSGGNIVLIAYISWIFIAIKWLIFSPAAKSMIIYF